MPEAYALTPRRASGGGMTEIPGGWRLEIPAGGRGAYRLAQLDDYASLSRRRFPWRPPLSLSLRARLSASGLPGTWGFGLWNDPFGLSLGFGGTPGRLPAPPEAAWFFYASPQSHLALRDDLPGAGFFAGSIRSLPATIVLAPALLGLPLLPVRPFSRWLRRRAASLVQQAATSIELDVTRSHRYNIDWLREGTQFSIDGRVILKTHLAPHPPLALVLWIDNQYAAWRPDGRLAYGVQENPAAWLEITELKLE